METKESMKEYATTFYDMSQKDYKLMLSKSFNMDLYLQEIFRRCKKNIQEKSISGLKTDVFFFDIPLQETKEMENFFIDKSSFIQTYKHQGCIDVLINMIKDELQKLKFKAEVYNINNSNKRLVMEWG